MCIFVFLYLTYFVNRDIFQVQPCWHKWQNFILSYGWVIFHCLYVCICISSPWCRKESDATELDTPHPFCPFLCWGILRLIVYLDCAMNVAVHVLFWTRVVIFFRCIPRSKISESYIVLFSGFWKIAYEFPQWLPQWALPPTVYKLPFS